MQSVRSRIWTRIAVSISCDYNNYTTGNDMDGFQATRKYKNILILTHSLKSKRNFLTHCIYSTSNFLRSSLCILPMDLEKQRGTRTQKNTILHSDFSMETLEWNRIADGDSSHTQRSWRESKRPAGTEFQLKFLTSYSLKTPTWPIWLRFFNHAMLGLH